MLKTLSRWNPVRVVRRAQRLIEALDRLPELESKVERCMVAYQEDARLADRLSEFQAAINVHRIQEHVRRAVAAATLEHEPCAYLVIDNLLPEHFYDEMIRALPPKVFFKPYPHDRTREELEVPFTFAPAYSRQVWDVFVTAVVEEALVPALTEKFRPALDEFLAANWPALGKWSESGLALEVWNSRLLLRRPGYVIRPHRDPRWAFLTALVYLQKRGADHVYGTQMYRWKQERSHRTRIRSGWTKASASWYGTFPAAATRH